MDKIVGIPRSFLYYDHHILWETFLSELRIPYIVSPKTNEQIMRFGQQDSHDEMCLSLKNYLGHVHYLEDKCDYLLVPRVDNYGLYNQTCTNFLALYDIVHNVTNKPILNYNIDYCHGDTEWKGFLKMGLELGKKRAEIKDAYHHAKEKEKEYYDHLIGANYNALNNSKPRILIIAHNYVLYDEMIGLPITNMFQKMGATIIDANLFDQKVALRESRRISSGLYWDTSRKLVGAIPIVEHNIDGIVFLSSFPCGLDSLVNELVMRKIKKPYLNLVVDDISSLTGMETRIESFMDILNVKI